MLIAISLIAFIISINAPRPVERLSKSAGNEGGVEQEQSIKRKTRNKKKIRT